MHFTLHCSCNCCKVKLCLQARQYSVNLLFIKNNSNNNKNLWCLCICNLTVQSLERNTGKFGKQCEQKYFGKLGNMQNVNAQTWQRDSIFQKANVTGKLCKRHDTEGFLCQNLHNIFLKKTFV